MTWVIDGLWRLLDVLVIIAFVGIFLVFGAAIKKWAKAFFGRLFR